MKVLVFGGSGLVGSRFVELSTDKFEIKAPKASEVDILDKQKISRIVSDFNPVTIINFAAYTNVEEAEKQRGDKSGVCYQINAEGARNVAEVCNKLGKHLIHISTDYVFDGIKSDRPYTEKDKPNPINWYGATKYFGEQFVLESGCYHTLIRISMPYSAHYNQKGDIARFFLEQLKNKDKISAIVDQKITPTLVDDIANALIVIVDKKPTGIYHLASTNHITPLEFARLIAQTFNLDSTLITAITLEEYNKKKLAKLLKNSWLEVSKFAMEFGPNILHTVKESLQLFKATVDPD